MKQTITLAGGTGNLGGRIIRDLIKRGAAVRALVRPETNSEKVEKLGDLGAEVITVEMSNAGELKQACEGASCVVSALSGLRDVMVVAQIQLLEAAIAGRVRTMCYHIALPSEPDVRLSPHPAQAIRNVLLIEHSFSTSNP